MNERKITKATSAAKYVIEISPGEYLTYVGGDWGPDYLPNRDVTKAVMLDLDNQAWQYVRDHWTKDPYSLKSIKIRKILVDKTIEIEFLD
jgi:hypothetical protein